jgi:ATP-dependent helicase/nuclease subunit B
VIKARCVTAAAQHRTDPPWIIADVTTLHLVLGTDLDRGTGWRVLLPEGAARSGWSAVGAAGLLRRLRTMLGLPPADAHPGERTAAYLRVLQSLDDGTRSYSRALAADPLGTAAYVLELRDALRAAGWAGGELDGSARLRNIAAAEAELPDGVRTGRADGFHQVLDALAAAVVLPCPLVIQLAEPDYHFDFVTRAVLGRIAELGAEVIQPPADEPHADGTSDLGRLQRALMGGPAEALVGDGTVVVLDAETPLEAAELLASWWRDHRRPDATWIVPRDADLLDTAMHRYDLPRVGGTATRAAPPTLQVLPLRLALAFTPQDPMAAMELLTLPCAPLPWRLRRDLQHALSNMPAVWSEKWLKAVEKHPDHADQVAAWFAGTPTGSDGIRRADVVEICRHVADWARARGAAESPEAAAYHDAAAVADRLARMVAGIPGDGGVTRLLLEQLHAAAQVGGQRQQGGEAGCPAVAATPAAAVGRYDHLVWWGWVGDESPASIHWTHGERAALDGAGLDVAPPGTRQAQSAALWLRAVLQASERVVLVRWRLEGSAAVGEHPLADRLAACLGADWSAHCIVDAAAIRAGESGALAHWLPATVPVAPSPAVAPVALWRVPAGTLEAQHTLSPSSIERRIACPLQWTLKSVAELRAEAPGLPSDPITAGNTAHAVLGNLLLDRGAAELDALADDACREHWGAEFDRVVAATAATLLMPGKEGDRARLRETVISAGAALARILARSGLRVIAAEKPVSGTFAGQAYAGRLDLLLEGDGRHAIIDMKLSRDGDHATSVEKGRALQLALYAHAGRDAGAYPPTAYFIVSKQRLLTTSDAFNATPRQGPDSAAIIAAAEAEWHAGEALLRKGMVLARGKHALAAGTAALEQLELAPLGVHMDLKPSCDYCDYRTLCTATSGFAPAAQNDDEQNV